MPNWLPIANFFEVEPASPDVLIYDGEVRVGYYDDNEHCWWDAVEKCCVQPTHWMPLPKPPAA